MKSAFVTLVLAASLIPSVSSADDEGGRDQLVTKQRADASIRVAEVFAAQYEFRDAENGATKLAYVDEPLLRWTNPVPQSAGQELPEVYGGVFLWTRDGRPSAAASIFRWYHPWQHVNLEMMLLDERPVVQTLDGVDVWQPKRSDVTYAPIPDAGEPARAKGTRLLQMRQLVRGFTVTKADADDNRTELRLLPQPLYRYEIAKPETAEVFDGALFVFAHGTDPELLVMVEAHRDSGGTTSWRFAGVRSNHLNMWMTYRDREIWRVQRIAPYSVVLDPTEPYCQLKRTKVEVEAADAELEEAKKGAEGDE